MSAREINFDGLVGPTHNYAGLSLGNLASARSRHEASNPREAALQGLRKMKALHDLGVGQGVLPPQDRPAIDILRRLGFAGRDATVLQNAHRQDPALLAGCASSSSMWAANAATVCPSADSGNRKVHFTPANLVSHFHRSIETETTARILRAVFDDEERFVHHAPLPSIALFSDEGAANHSRLCRKHGELGVHLFVYGRRILQGKGGPSPARYPARQTFEASTAVARLHELDAPRVVFAQQLPSSVDAGVFHNDVIAVGNENVFVFHEEAFVEQTALKQSLESKLEGDLRLIEIPRSAISIEEAVSTYLFNSQLVTLPTGKMAWIVPEECRASGRVWSCLRDLLAAHPELETLEVVDVRQSMRNGGGPACLRLRVVLTDDELEHVNGATLFDEGLYRSLSTWVETHYRDRLVAEDLADPELLRESREALEALTQILRLGSIYSFQR